MMIPKMFKLGKREVHVTPYPRAQLLGGALAGFYHNVWMIAIAVRRPRKQVAESFWHETTHAILHDMGHPLWKDEKFVTAFSKRLAQVVDTAVL